MTEKILRYAISVFEAFNDVRNSKNLAHDNAILNRAESILIFQNVTSAIRFQLTLEEPIYDPNALPTDKPKLSMNWAAYKHR